MSTTPHSTFTRQVPRAIAATVGVLGMFTLSACATDDDTAAPETTAATDAASDTDTAADTETDEDSAVTDAAGSTTTLTADVSDADGTQLGTVTIAEGEESLEFDAEFSGMEPGFYGFHIHQIGECEPDSAAPDDPEDTGDFMSAGGHLGSDEAEHPDHAGDLPQLLVQESGEAWMAFQTDRLTLADLQDDDGAAMMIHTDPDNYGNIPERYAPEGPDDDTTSTGDAGSRLACGVIS